MKFGQFIASAPAAVGEDVAKEFRSCLDTGPPVAFTDVRAIIEHDIGRPLRDIFARFEETPFAAASMSVVFDAQLHDGRRVAVKVLRPGIGRIVAADLAILQPLVRFLARQGSDTASTLLNYLIGLQEQIREELDLRNEAEAMGQFAAAFKAADLPLLVVPDVYHELTSRRVLTMEFLDGVPIDDLTQIAALERDPRPLVVELLHAWLVTGVRFGAFHADIHAGNLLLLADGRLGVIDWGIVARLDADMHLLFRRLVEAGLGIESAWGDIVAHVLRVQGSSLRDGLGLSDAQVAQLVRAMLEPVLTRPVGEGSMAVLFGSSDELIRLATGETPPRRTARDRFNIWSKARRSNRIAIELGVGETNFRRANFLAAKQLIYLERYWKIYLADEAILGDHAFLERLLASSEANTHTERESRG